MPDASLLMSDTARQLIRMELEFDRANHDVTSDAVVPEEATATGRYVTRQPGVASGLDLIRLVFEEIDPDVEVHCETKDGEPIREGEVMATVHGPARSILSGERTSLNFVSLLSGVATATRRFVDAVEGTRARIYDTRKTIPGLRELQKYAVRCGGGFNHRMSLGDQVLVKDNHLSLAHRDPDEIGELAKALRREMPYKLKIEVELDDLHAFDDVIRSGVEVVMLDNFTPERFAEARKRLDEANLMSPPALEVSGGVTVETVRAFAEAGADRIAVGYLTHSAPWLDVSLEFVADD